MANIFEAVRKTVAVPLAAERYGLKANRAGMVCCPFHDDHTPSLKLNEDYRKARKRFSETLRNDVVDLLLYPHDGDEPHTPRANFSLDLLELSVEYTPEEYAKHIAALRALVKRKDNLRLTLLPSAPFRGLQIVAMGDTVTVLRCREPYAAFVFTSPMLTQSMSDYFASLIKLHNTDRDATVRRLEKWTEQ